MYSSTRTALLLGLAILTLVPGPALARTRISTGRDLYMACQALADAAVAQQGPTPRIALYCRQYLAGYFSSARYVAGNDDARRALDLPPASDECASVPGPQSWDHLAARIVHQGDWQPALLDGPALDLARAAFGSKPPC